MPEIGMSVSMSGDGKRGVGHRPQATAPILDSTTGLAALAGRRVRSLGYSCRAGQSGGTVLLTRSGVRGPVAPWASCFRCDAQHRAHAMMW
jgi:hypothetical protein